MYGKDSKLIIIQLIKMIQLYRLIIHSKRLSYNNHSVVTNDSDLSTTLNRLKNYYHQTISVLKWFIPLRLIWRYKRIKYFEYSIRKNDSFSWNWSECPKELFILNNQKIDKWFIMFILFWVIKRITNLNHSYLENVK